MLGSIILYRRSLVGWLSGAHLLSYLFPPQTTQIPQYLHGAFLRWS
jgi:hypothetical protein